MGAFALLITRRALPFDSLDLGVWHGLNELVTKKSFRAKAVHFKLFLKPGSYLSFQYGRNQNGYKGFTFSANQHINSKYFVADNEGIFSENSELSIPVRTGGWNEIHLEFTDEQSKLFVNGEFVRSFSPTTGEQSFGFKGPAATGTLVDDIKVIREGGAVWTEDFSNTRNRPIIFLASWAALFLALGLSHKLLNKENRYLRTAGLSLAAWIVAFFLNQADKIYFALFYVQSDSPATALHRNTLGEMLTFKPRNQEKKFIYEKLKPEYFKTESENKFKIMFMGSSQTWGSGARYPQDIVSEKFGKYLREKIPDKSFEIFNGAVPGEITKDQFENFLEFSKAFPQVVILNMSVNDNRSLEVFKEYLLRFVHLSQKENFRLILIPEPFFDENQTVSRSSQELVEKVALENNIKVIPVQKYLEEKANSGFLWWDVVHMSSYGQDLLARKLADQLHEAVRSEIERFEGRRRAGPWRQN